MYPESNAVEMELTVEKKQPGSFGSATRSHIRNFLECIETRKDPKSNVEAGQATSMFFAWQ